MVYTPQTQFTVQGRRRLKHWNKGLHFQIKDYFVSVTETYRLLGDRFCVRQRNFWGCVDCFLGVSPPGMAFTFFKWPNKQWGWTLFHSTWFTGVISHTPFAYTGSSCYKIFCTGNFGSFLPFLLDFFLGGGGSKIIFLHVIHCSPVSTGFFHKNLLQSLDKP